MAGRKQKEFHEYLSQDFGDSHVSHLEYVRSPGTAFLRHTVEAKNAIDLCIRHFPKKTDGKTSKASKDSIQHLTLSVLPTVMGHFETFQRYLFGGVFDRSIHLLGFDIERFFRKIKKNGDFTIDPVRLSAYRGLGAASIGTLLADSLTGWHAPSRVNQFFECFELNNQFWGEQEIEQLRVLWQLRHSIVHTGGTLTRADAQKVAVFSDKGDLQIVFEDNFIFEVARKLHPMVKKATNALGDAFHNKLKAEIDDQAKRDLERFFEVKSSVSVWLR